MMLHPQSQLHKRNGERKGGKKDSNKAKVERSESVLMEQKAG